MFLKLAVLFLALFLTGCDFLFPPGDVINSVVIKSSNNPQLTSDVKGMIFGNDIILDVPYTAIMENKFFIMDFSLASSRYKTNPSSGSTFDATRNYAINVMDGNSVSRTYSVTFTSRPSSFNFLDLRSPAFFDSDNNRITLSGYEISNRGAEIEISIPAGQYERAMASRVAFEEVNVAVGVNVDLFDLRHGGVAFPHLMNITGPDGKQTEFEINATRIASATAGINSVSVMARYEYTRNRHKIYNKSDWPTFRDMDRHNIIFAKRNDQSDQDWVVHPGSSFPADYNWFFGRSITSSNVRNTFRISDSWAAHRGAGLPVGIRNAWDSHRNVMAGRRDYIQSVPDSIVSTDVFRSNLVEIPGDLVFRNFFNPPGRSSEFIGNFTENIQFNIGPNQVLPLVRRGNNSDQWGFIVNPITYQLKSTDEYRFIPRNRVWIEQFIIELEPFAIPSNFISTSSVSSYEVIGDRIIVDVVNGYYDSNTIILIFDVTSETGITETYILRSST